MGALRRAKDWGVKIWLVISLIMGIATLTIGSHGVSKINADRNTKMLDRIKYLATFIYEILTACFKIVDPLLGLACLYTKKKIYLQIFLGLKTFLISSQLVGTTYLYTIRLNFEQLTNTRYEACYYKFGNDTECTEAWQSLQNTYEECGNATTIIRSTSTLRYLYFLQKQSQQQIRLWQLIESLPTLVKNTDEIIDNTTINGTTTNVLDWWNSVANTTQTVYDEYLKNISIVTSKELDRLIRLVPENLQNIWSVINSTTISGEGSTTATTMTVNSELSTDDSNISISEYSTIEVNTITSPSSEELYSTEYVTALLRILPEVVRQQSPIQYTTNILQWWIPFKQLLLNIEKEYQQMIAIRSLPPSPPPECQQDLYHMRYIATDLTVSVIIYSINMITDVASFASMINLSNSLRKFTNIATFQRF